MRLTIASLLAALAWLLAGPGQTAHAGRHCGACTYPSECICKEQCCQPTVRYKVCYQTVVEEQQQVCYRPIYRTVMKECRYTIYKPCYETHYRDCKYTVCKTITEPYD